MQEILLAYLSRLSNKKGLKKSILNMNLAKKYSYIDREQALTSGLQQGLIIMTRLPKLNTKTKKTATIFSITSKGEKSLQQYVSTIKEQWYDLK